MAPSEAPSVVPLEALSVEVAEWRHWAVFLLVLWVDWDLWVVAVVHHILEHQNPCWAVVLVFGTLAHLGTTILHLDDG